MRIRYHSITMFGLFLLLIWVMPDTMAARVEDKSLGWPGYDLQGIPCMGRSQGFGPYDYTDPKYAAQLRNVEGHHLSIDVERLKSGVSASVVEDLDYTLRAFPNHHRALYAMLRYRESVERHIRDVFAATECYLQRAMAFAPEDATLPLLYGIFLHKKGMFQQALEYYEKAQAQNLKSAELHYNMGLVLVDLKRYSEANIQANIAYSLGYPLPGLKVTLKQLGYWKEQQTEDVP